jgi:hypothetical protein
VSQCQFGRIQIQNDNKELRCSYERLHKLYERLQVRCAEQSDRIETACRILSGTQGKDSSFPEAKRHGSMNLDCTMENAENDQLRVRLDKELEGQGSSVSDYSGTDTESVAIDEANIGEQANSQPSVDPEKEREGRRSQLSDYDETRPERMATVIASIDGEAYPQAQDVFDLTFQPYGIQKTRNPVEKQRPKRISQKHVDYANKRQKVLREADGEPQLANAENTAIEDPGSKTVGAPNESQQRTFDFQSDLRPENWEPDERPVERKGKNSAQPKSALEPLGDFLHNRKKLRPSVKRNSQCKPSASQHQSTSAPPESKDDAEGDGNLQRLQELTAPTHDIRDETTSVDQSAFTPSSTAKDKSRSIAARLLQKKKPRRGDKPYARPQDQLASKSSDITPLSKLFQYQDGSQQAKVQGVVVQLDENSFRIIDESWSESKSILVGGIVPTLEKGDCVLLQGYTVCTEDRSLLCSLNNLGEGTHAIFKRNAECLDEAGGEAVGQSKLANMARIYERWLTSIHA